MSNKRIKFSHKIIVETCDLFLHKIHQYIESKIPYSYVYEWILEFEKQPLILKSIFTTHLNRTEFYAIVSVFIKTIKWKLNEFEYDQEPEELLFQFWQQHIDDSNTHEQVVDEHNKMYSIGTPNSTFIQLLQHLIIELIRTNLSNNSEIYRKRIESRVDLLTQGFLKFIQENHIYLSLNDIHDGLALTQTLYKTKYEQIYQYIKDQRLILHPDYDACIKYVDQLSDSERDILCLYTAGSNAFQDISHRNPVNDLDRALLERIFINAPRLTKPMKVWRGVGKNRIYFHGESKDMKDFIPLRDSFLSTTFDLKVALEFIAESGCCLLHITFPIGFPLLCLDAVSFFEGNEREMLGPKPTHLMYQNHSYQIQTNITGKTTVQVFEYAAFWHENKVTDKIISDEENNARYLIDQFTDVEIDQRILRILNSEMNVLVSTFVRHLPYYSTVDRHKYYMNLIRNLRIIYIQVWGYNLKTPSKIIIDRLNRIFWHFMALIKSQVNEKEYEKIKIDLERALIKDADQYPERHLRLAEVQTDERRS